MLIGKSFWMEIFLFVLLHSVWYLIKRVYVDAMDVLRRLRMRLVPKVLQVCALPTGTRKDLSLETFVFLNLNKM